MDNLNSLFASKISSFPQITFEIIRRVDSFINAEDISNPGIGELAFVILWTTSLELFCEIAKGIRGPSLIKILKTEFSIAHLGRSEISNVIDAEAN